MYQQVQLPTVDSTWEEVTKKLGGEFDYTDFGWQCSNLLDEAQIEYEKFKRGRLVVPEPSAEMKEL